MTDARSITLGLRGHWFGHHGQARCPAHGDRRPSLSLTNSADGRLLMHCHAGCDFATILDALRGRGLVEDRGRFAPPASDELASFRAAKKVEARNREAQARACWTEAKPILGTLGETYLRFRSITCGPPSTLRFHPNCWHPTAQRLPAVVARVEGGGSFAVHRTYLRPDGRGKADVEPTKAMLGLVAGGAVQVVTQTEDANLPLVVAEGIETALSLASGLLRSPAAIWAALSTSGLRDLRLPSRPGKLTIASDGDRPGREAAHHLASIANALGWQVSLLPAPEGCDWNDVLMLGTRKEGAA